MSDTVVGASVTGAPPLALPYYRAPYLAAVRRFFAKYATFPDAPAVPSTGGGC